MDELVQQAMAKWPNVPDCYGWLGLDARGDWYMRDDQTQAQGSFVKSKGSRLTHENSSLSLGATTPQMHKGVGSFKMARSAFMSS